MYTHVHVCTYALQCSLHAQIMCGRWNLLFPAEETACSEAHSTLLWPPLLVCRNPTYCNHLNYTCIHEGRLPYTLTHTSVSAAVV